MDAAAGEQQRALGAVEDGGGALHRRRVGATAQGGDALARLVHVESLLAEIELAVRDVLRHVEDDGAGPPAGRHREGAAHMLRNALADLDADHLLHRRRQHLDLAGLLGHVLPGVRPVGVAHHGDHRHAGVQRLHQRGQQVGGAGAEGRIDHARPPGHARPGVGGEGPAALVVDERVGHAERAHAVIEGQELEARHAPDRRAAIGVQHFGDGAAAIHPPRRVVAPVGHAKSSANWGTVMPGAAPAARARLLAAESRPVFQSERASPMRAVAPSTAAAGTPMPAQGSSRLMPALVAAHAGIVADDGAHDMVDDVARIGGQQRAVAAGNDYLVAVRGFEQRERVEADHARREFHAGFLLRRQDA